MTYLQRFRNHKRFVQVAGYIVEPHEYGHDYYVILEYYRMTLGRFIKAYSNEGKLLPTPLVKRFLRQLLEGVMHMHENMVLHRDLKPENILLDDYGNIKIADFGLSKTMRFSCRKKSLRVGTMYYRPPEIYMGYEKYQDEIDMWAIGCIFAEMLKGAPLF